MALGRTPAATPIVYGVSLVVALIALFAGIGHLLGGSAPVSVTLPLGLPWLGAHFRLDALSAFFLVVVNLGAAAASLYAFGYGRHEPAPERVLPFYPAFLAGMNLVVLADDAFTFLVSWEFMSLSSWALVMSHHRERDNVYAGYVYLVMASFGTLALLLTFGLLAGPDGGYGFDAMRAAHPSASLAALVLILALRRRRLEGRPGAAACLAAARASGGAEPCLGADERRHDQGRDLRLHPHRVRPARAARMVVEHAGVAARRRDRGDGRALRRAAGRSEAAPGLQHDREYRHRLRRARPCARLQGERDAGGSRARA